MAFTRMAVRMVVALLTGLAVLGGGPAHAANSGFIRVNPNPFSASFVGPVSGLSSQETLVGVDFRPTTGTLYGVATDGAGNGRVYTIDASTGTATPVGSPFGGVAGTAFGVDFNPAADRVRFVTNAAQSFDIDPGTGDPVGPPSLLSHPVTAIASHPLTSVLYGIRAGPTELVRIDGTQVTGLFTLPVTTAPTTPVGFDIADDGTGFLSVTPGLGTVLFALDVTTGATMPRGTVSNDTNAVAGLAIAPSGPPTSLRPTNLEFTRVVPTADAASVSFTVRLTTADDGAPLPGKLVTIDGEIVGVVTNGNGEATTVIQPFSQGFRAIDAQFLGDAAYLESYTLFSFILGPQTADGQVIVSRADGAFAASGGPGIFDLTTFPPDAGWTASSNDPSIVEILSVEIASARSVTGDGVVTYQVARHLDPLAGRQATLTIAGLTVTIFQGAAFRDVPESDPFYTFIGKLSARGVTSGIGGGNYGSDQPITRGQMAVFVIRALGEPDPPPSMQSFADVPPTHPFFRFIQRMKTLGITSGCSATAYCPDAPVTRGQMAVFLIRAFFP